MSYPHLMFDRWEDSFLWVLWSCRAVPLPSNNADGMAFQLKCLFSYIFFDLPVGQIANLFCDDAHYCAFNQGS